METTLSIIKNNAVKKNVIGDIIKRFESEDLRIAGMKMMQLDKQTAGAFYQEHEGKPFFNSLLDFMTSGPVVVMVLEGENAIKKNREIMGNTNPEKAAENTLRKLYADSFTENAVHGSDSPESAKREINFFFSANEVMKRFDGGRKIKAA